MGPVIGEVVSLNQLVLDEVTARARVLPVTWVLALALIGAAAVLVFGVPGPRSAPPQPERAPNARHSHTSPTPERAIAHLRRVPTRRHHEQQQHRRHASQHRASARRAVDRSQQLAPTATVQPTATPAARTVRPPTPGFTGEFF
jgi:hypothetical protein